MSHLKNQPTMIIVFFVIYIFTDFLALALVDKLYTAQKVREDAMLTRMKLLMDEKEELIQRMRKLEKDKG